MTQDDFVKEQLRAHLDRNMLSPRELDADLALVLERRARRRSLVAHVALPGVFAAAALALFAVMRAPSVETPRPNDGESDAVLIYIADSGDPSSAIVIDFILQSPSEK